MIIYDPMIMIGATGRNIGKTEFAISLIEHLCKDRPVIGLKVTTVREREGVCPRGGQGCGVCSSFEGHYLLTREATGPDNKDTTKMLNAGAREVFWLRVHHEYLTEGINDFLKTMEAYGNPTVICESNSLRTVVEPGQFIIIKGKDDQVIKPSCREVLCFPHEVVVFDDGDFTCFNDAHLRIVEKYTP